MFTDIGNVLHVGKRLWDLQQSEPVVADVLTIARRIVECKVCSSLVGFGSSSFFPVLLNVCVHRRVEEHINQNAILLRI